MIKKLKSVLLEIRGDRERELEKYRGFCRDDQALYEKRKAILTLELPYKTDSVSIMQARAEAYQENENIRNALLGIDHEYAMEDGNLVPQKRVKNHPKSAYTLIQDWINSASCDATKRGRRTLYYVLKKWIANFYDIHPQYDKIMVSSPNTLSAEYLPHVLTLESMETVINGLDVDSSAKEVYLSLARNLREFIEKTSAIIPAILKGQKSVLSLNEAAIFFEFLETRALKSTTTRAYHDILLCRALFYAPLPEKKFYHLGIPNSTIDKKSFCLRTKEKEFYVPSSFIKLWGGFSCPNSLFLRTFDDRQLHKKIHRLGEYAKLKSLTPSILRSTAKTAYVTYLEISDDVVQCLPPRS